MIILNAVEIYDNALESESRLQKTLVPRYVHVVYISWKAIGGKGHNPIHEK